MPWGDGPFRWEGAMKAYKAVVRWMWGIYLNAPQLSLIPHGTPSLTEPSPHYNPSGGCRRAGAVVEGAGEDAARMLLRLIRLL